jgi:hypothetical protein
MIEKPDGHSIDISLSGDLLLLLGIKKFSVCLSSLLFYDLQ